MRFAIEELPKEVFPRQPQPGDVFAAKGGNGTTALWLMVGESATGQSGHYLGLDEQGQIVSTASYGHHAMRPRRLVAKVDLTEMVIPMEPVNDQT